MPDTHTPAQLAAILAPLWEACPEARPSIPVDGYPFPAVLHLGANGHWYFGYREPQCSGIVGYTEDLFDEVVIFIILASLQLAIEKRCNRASFTEGGCAEAWWRCEDGRMVSVQSSNPDPIIARAQLLARILGVKLGDTP